MSDGKRRVLWVIKGLGPGGAERLLCAAARAHDHDRFHIECAYVLPWKDHLAEELERSGVRTHCLSRAQTDRLWPLRLTRLVQSGTWDVVHVHSPLPGSVARVAARTMRRSERPLLASTEHNRWATHRLPTRIANRVTSRWDATSFAVTDEVRVSMSGPVAKRAETLRHGIDVETAAKAAADRAAVRVELGLEPKEFVVGTVANFRPQKDYPNLLKAARILVDRDVAVRFVAVGQGPQEERIRRLRDGLGLQSSVIFTGFRDDAVRVMGACDVFTLASQWEGLPVALMEALALGLPVVATAVGGVAEELTNDVDALLVPPGDADALAAAIERIAEDDELRTVLSDASLRRARDFDVRRAVERIEQIYGGGTSHGESPAPNTAPPRRRPSGLDIRPATPDDRPAILELCRASLGWGDDPRFEQLFSWKHDQNAFGSSYMWVATDAGRVVGLRAFMQWEFRRDAEITHAVRAVDTAIHPNYQGKGLFKATTLHALHEMRQTNVEFIFNTPNERSKPGYLSMGWLPIGKVQIAIIPSELSAIPKMIKSRTAASHWPTDLRHGEEVESYLAANRIESPSSPDRGVLATHRTNEYLSWRYGANFLGYRVMTGPGGVAICRLRERGTSLELVIAESFGQTLDASTLMSRRLARQVGASHVLKISHSQTCMGLPTRPRLGPTLVWRGLKHSESPNLANWRLSMGDLELF